MWWTLLREYVDYEEGYVWDRDMNIHRNPVSLEVVGVL